ncbi:hypothetical protein ACOI1H_18945 [Loktanella sp. DJP18]|uniref:hypothetical protein n=1 Tax=Loktanella sp. DJP18 TaxID=3409788 RepID=UPI003BB49ECE
MNTNKKVVMSVASIAAALQVLGGAAAEQKTLDTTTTTEFSKEVKAGMASAQAQIMITRSTAVIANVVKIDNLLMGERYAQVQGEAATKASAYLTKLQSLKGAPYDVAAANTPYYEDDSTGYSLTLSCYTNCHNACHGSRGWR